MPSIKINFLVSILFLSALVGFKVYAEEAEEGRGEEAKSDGTTPGEQSKGTGKSTSSEGGSNADREWAKRKTKLNILETKMKDYTKELEHLIHVKNTGGAAVDEKGKPIDVLLTIASSYKNLKESVSEYNTETAELKYRYPEEGARIERRYVPLRIQTLDQIEKNSGLDAELTRTKKKIDRKYASFVGDELVKPPEQKAALPSATLRNKEREKEEESQRIHFSQ